MGFSQSLCKLLAQEHAYKPFEGNFVLLGRQTTGITFEEAIDIIKKAGLEPRSSVDIVYDSQTKGQKKSNEAYITEKTFLTLLSDVQVLTIDVTSYESCDIIHDFTKPIPDELKNIADVFWLGSCLDNMSNPSAALNNAFQIVKPNGRIIDFECSQMKLSAYVAFSPCFFIDWLAINEFKDVRLYLLGLKRSEVFRGQWDIYTVYDSGAAAYKYNFQNLPSDYIILTYWIGEKGSLRPFAKDPIQAKYRPKKDNKPYIKHLRLWRQSNNRPLIKPTSPDNIDHHEIKYYKYLGKI